MSLDQPTTTGFLGLDAETLGLVPHGLDVNEVFSTAAHHALDPEAPAGTTPDEPCPDGDRRVPRGTDEYR